MINSLNDIKKYVNDKIFKKIFIISGQKSFITSGAIIFLKNFTR